MLILAVALSRKLEFAPIHAVKTSDNMCVGHNGMDIESEIAHIFKLTIIDTLLNLRVFVSDLHVFTHNRRSEYFVLVRLCVIR